MMIKEARQIRQKFLSYFNSHRFFTSNQLNKLYKIT